MGTLCGAGGSWQADPLGFTSAPPSVCGPLRSLGEHKIRIKRFSGRRRVTFGFGLNRAKARIGKRSRKREFNRQANGAHGFICTTMGI